jgi:hypothetical protein
MPAHRNGPATVQHVVAGNALMQAQPFTQWERPQAPNPNISTNDRRNEAASRHQRITPVMPAFVSSKVRTPKGRGGAPVRTRVTASDLPQHYKFDIAILGNPVRSLLFVLDID